MFGDKLASVRQSLEMKGSVGTKMAAMRDSAKADLPEYSIDVELSDNNKKMLQAFKQNSGYYHVSPKKQKNTSPSKKSVPEPVLAPIPEAAPVQVPRIYLFGKNSGDYQTKAEEPVLQSKTLTATKSNYHPSLPDTIASLQPIITGKHRQFLKQVLETLGIINSNDTKLQFEDLMNQAYARFLDMKGNGRWQLIQKYFKAGEEDELNYSCVTIGNRSIIKKKSIADTQVLTERKKVKLIQPQTASQLIRTKFKLAEELQNHIKNLTRGFKFQKFCYNSNKTEEITLYLSYDLKCLAWKSKGKQPIVQSMLNYTGITDGARSKNFMKFMIKKVSIDEQLAFSIILKNRTLDLISPTLEQKQLFVQGMKFVKSFT